MTYADWEREHIGPYLYTRGTVWWCGDYVCDCTQAQVDAVYRNIVTGNSLIFKRVWEGPFYTDGEDGATADLQRFHDDLATVWPEAAAQIRWPESVEMTGALDQQIADAVADPNMTPETQRAVEAAMRATYDALVEHITFAEEHDGRGAI
jgi:hypothetical protein